jgi:hypothetical protein
VAAELDVVRELLKKESEAKAAAESKLSVSRKQGDEQGEREQQWTEREQQVAEREQQVAEREAEQERGWEEQDILLSQREARVAAYESGPVQRLRGESREESRGDSRLKEGESRGESRHTLTPMKTPARTLTSEFGSILDVEGDGGDCGRDGGENNKSRSPVYVSPNKIR